MQAFIDEDEIWQLLHANEDPTIERVREVIAKALNKERLSLEETAVLINANDPALIEEIKAAAKELKERVYGKRIVLFAPLYIGNLCINDCTYCGFRTSNKKQKRTTLTKDDVVDQVKALEDTGHKRLILVYGEHPRYDANFIAESVKMVYGVKHKNGEIRRVNIRNNFV